MDSALLGITTQQDGSHVVAGILSLHGKVLCRTHVDCKGICAKRCQASAQQHHLDSFVERSAFVIRSSSNWDEEAILPFRVE